MEKPHKNLNLSDIFGSAYLQKLQDEIANLVGMSLVLVDLHGAQITEPSNPLGFCRIMRGKKEAGGTCDEVNGAMIVQAMQTRQSVIRICPHSGLHTAATPIFLEDDFLGIWMIGQVRLRDPGETLLVEDDEVKLTPPIQELLNSVPYLWKSALLLVLELLSTMTCEVARLITNNNQMQKSNKRLRELTERTQNSMDMMRAFMNTADLIIYLADFKTYEIVMCNDNYAAVFGRTAEQIVGEKCYQLMGHSQPCDFCPQRHLLDENGHLLPPYTWEHYSPVYTAWMQCTSRAAHWVNGRLVLVNTIMDITQRRQLEEEVNKLAFEHIIDPGIAMWSGIEVLCRWNSPELGPVPPGDFIPVAESGGLIRQIGHWVLEEAILHAKKWRLDEIEGFLLEGNLSPVQLAMQDLAQSVVELLRRYNYPPHKLCLEVTESNELNFSRHNLESIEQLHQEGVVIALDDFGTGYSSFNSLHKLPVKIVKTDRSFINGMEHDLFLQRLFHAMVELAHASDMKIVAEGVETEFQAKFLYQQGADYFQGYLFSKPLTAEQIEEKLHFFHSVSAELVSMGYAKLNIASLTTPGDYTFSPAMSSVVNYCIQELFTKAAI